MSSEPGRLPDTVGEALARQVEVRRGPASPWAEQLRELGAVDRAVY
jgi:undecaprenyl-diphosphatase